MHKLSILAVLMLTAGCTTQPTTTPTNHIVPESKVINIDPEELESKYVTEMYQPTSNRVVAANVDDIIIDARNASTYFDEDRNTHHQQWEITVQNLSYTNKCVAVEWRTMGFRLITNEPYEFYMEGQSMFVLGYLIEVAELIDGVWVVPPTSAYIQNISVRPVNRFRITDPDDPCLSVPNHVIEQ